MIDICSELHGLVDHLPHHHFPFDEAKISANGIYFLFEDGEKAHDTDRIVRIGTHTGSSQLRSRLKQHFIMENKDRSIFRKNIGRALLNKDQDPFLQQWEIDLTTRAAKDSFGHRIDFEKQKQIESQVTRYIQNHFRFIVLPISQKDDRLKLESRIISTLSLCRLCKPSPEWLGQYSTKEKIRESGLWLVNELFKQQLSQEEFENIYQIISSEK
jgi:hypothetical protein